MNSNVSRHFTFSALFVCLCVPTFAQEDEKKQVAETKTEVSSDEKEQPSESQDAAQENKPAKPVVQKEPEPVPRKRISIGHANTPLIRGQRWKVHDMNRPRPVVVQPGTPHSYKRPSTPPSDAIVLFDGKDLAQWGQVIPDDPDHIYEPLWNVEKGYAEVNPGTGSLRTLDTYSSCQLHIEWASPKDVSGSSQDRGNSGVLFMGLYEVQILDSFQNRTYADGQAASIYGQHPPLANVSRPPGAWQIYDIVFEAPKFVEGKAVEPAYITVMHNGVLVHHRRKLYGPVAHKNLVDYMEHQTAGPLVLQDHGSKVRFRNIWLRVLR